MSKAKPLRYEIGEFLPLANLTVLALDTSHKEITAYFVEYDCCGKRVSLKPHQIRARNTMGRHAMKIGKSIPKCPQCGSGWRQPRQVFTPKPTTHENPWISWLKAMSAVERERELVQDHVQ